MKDRLWFRRRFAALLALLVPTMLLGASIGQAATILPVQNATGDAENSLVPRGAQDPAGNLHLVWDTNDGSRKVAYRKGVWNGNGYNFGPVAILADLGSFQYSSPAIAIAPNGTAMAAWSSGFQLNIRTWNSRDAQPGGTGTQIMPGFDANIGVDAASRFHIVANGDFQIQYCQWENNGCTRQDAFARDRNARPDVAVDINGGVHVVTAGGGTINYFNRPAGGNWASSTLAGGGNAPQIAADGQGNVHAVWSQDYNIEYCRVANGTCTSDRKTFDGQSDLSPSIGATRSGNLVVAFYNSDPGFRRLWINTRENGVWSNSIEVADASVPVDMTTRPYSNRISAIWSLNYDIYVATVVLAPANCDVPLYASNIALSGDQLNTMVTGSRKMYLPMISNPEPPVVCRQ